MNMPLLNPVLTPTWLAANARGRGVEVAIIDSGVDGRHPRLHKNVKGGCAIAKGRGGQVVVRKVKQGRGCRDDFGHGTAVAGIIAEVAPATQFVSVRVLDEYNACSGEVLLAGLQWALDQKIRLINMSLATLMPAFVPRLNELCERAYAQNTIIVASRRNYGDMGYPAQFSSVIGVDREAYKELLRVHFRPRDFIEFEARGTDIRVLAPGGGYAVETGTSFATPHVCGIVALLLEVYPDLTGPEAKSALKGFSDHSRWTAKHD